MKRLVALAAGALFVLGACGATPTQSASKPSSQPAAAQSASAAPVGVITGPGAGTDTSAGAAQSAAAAPSAAAGASDAAPANSAAASASAPSKTAAPSATVAPSAAPSATTAANPKKIFVTLVDTAVKLSTTATPAGPTTFVVTNAGTVQHELVLLQTDLPANQIPNNPSQPGLVMQPGYLGQVATLAPGATGSLTLTLAPANYVLLCNLPAHYLLGMHAGFTVTAVTETDAAPIYASSIMGSDPDTVTVTGSTVNVTLSEMKIALDQTSVPSGRVTFLVTNLGTVAHELVVQQPPFASDQIPANPDEPGKVLETWWMGETGDIDSGHFSAVSLDLAPGTYALICNEPGHYMAGMHVTFTVTGTAAPSQSGTASAGAATVNVTLQEMSIQMSQTTVPAGRVTFLVTNNGTVQHEFVVLQTATAEDKLPAGDEPGKASEDGWVGETGDMDSAGHFSGLVLNLARGHYVVICNEPGHYAAGMHATLTVQ